MLQNKMSIADFLKDLPCHDTENFSLFNTENGIRTSLKRPSVYLPTEDLPAEQVIVTEKRSILLRYLHQQWEKKNPVRKRELAMIAAGETADGNTPRKRARWEANARESNLPSTGHQQQQQQARDNN